MMACVSMISGSSSIAIKPVPLSALSLFALAAAGAAVVLAPTELVDAESVTAELVDAGLADDMLLAWVFIAAPPVLDSGKPPATRCDEFNALATIANLDNSWRILCSPVRNATLVLARKQAMLYFVPDNSPQIEHKNRCCLYFTFKAKKASHS